MNTPKIDIGMSQEIIDTCASDSSCTCATCTCTEEECNNSQQVTLFLEVHTD